MGFLIDTCIWIEVERGSVAPADVAQFIGDEKDFIDIPGLDLAPVSQTGAIGQRGLEAGHTGSN